MYVHEGLVYSFFFGGHIQLGIRSMMLKWVIRGGVCCLPQHVHSAQTVLDSQEATIGVQGKIRRQLHD